MSGKWTYFFIGARGFLDLTLVRIVQLEARYHQDVGELKQQVTLDPKTQALKPPHPEPGQG